MTTTHNSHSTKRARLANAFAWSAACVIALFYILSSLGWFKATNLAANGLLGQATLKSFQSLTITDHIVRMSQVALVDLASVLLILRRRAAHKTFMLAFSVDLLATVLSEVWGFKWEITFLGGIGGLLVLALVLLCSGWLARRQFLR